MNEILFVNIIFSINLIICLGQSGQGFDSKICDQDLYFKNVLKPEIESKSVVVNKIIDLVLNTNERNKT